jgi:A/G-specific adenine glycosylase
MTGFPGTDWAEGEPSPDPPLAADWQMLPGAVTHVFTHFSLVLDVAVARVSADARPARGDFRPLDPASLPSLMAKVWARASAALQSAPGPG